MPLRWRDAPFSGVRLDRSFLLFPLLLVLVLAVLPGRVLAFHRHAVDTGDRGRLIRRRDVRAMLRVGAEQLEDVGRDQLILDAG